MSDLDNFFAKKDKNKKNKKKGISNDDFNKKYEAKPNEKSQEKKTIALGNLENYLQDDADWHDFEDENNKDYSGLKIQALSIIDKEEEQQAEEDSLKKEQNDTAWKVNSETESNKPEVKQVEETVPFFLRNLHRTPRINDTVEFPDLGTTAEEYEELKTFKNVRSSGLPHRIAPTNDTISSDNKFSAFRKQVDSN